MSEPRVHTGLGAHDNLKDHIYIYMVSSFSPLAGKECLKDRAS